MTLPSQLEAMANGPAAHKPADPEAIRDIEVDLGFKLPAEYVAFLLRSNGFEIDVDPIVQSAFRLHDVESIINESYAYGFDVRDEQVVLIGGNGVGSGYALDFRFEPVQFVRVSFYNHDRRNFEYLGDSLETFVGNVLADTTLKKPRGLAKRKKVKQPPNNVDPNRSPADSGPALILKDLGCETTDPADFISELGQFVFRAGGASYLLNPETGDHRQLLGDARRIFPPFAYYAPRNSLIGKFSTDVIHEWSVGEYDLEARS